MPTEDFTQYLPSVWDRADGGLTSQYGTPAPPGSIGVNYPGGNAAAYFEGVANGGMTVYVEESSDSPVIEFGEQCTITHTFFADYFGMQNIQAEYCRGYVMIDNSGNVSRVLSTTAQPISKTAGLIWKVAMVSEAESFANPPAEFDIQPVEVNPIAEKHPRYSALTYYQRSIIRGAVISDYIDVQQQYTSLITSFSSSNNQWQDQQGQALELLFKKQKGEDTFYLSGYKIIYSVYYWQPQDINPGGYVENPFSVVPYQFWVNGDGENIFANSALANQNLYPNPNSAPPTEYPYGLSWLRQTDVQTLNRTWYKVTQTWIGAPLGIWDNEWYNPTLQPLQTSQYGGNLNVG